MEFEVNVGEFINSIMPAIKVATKGLKNKDFNFVTIEAKENEIITTAFGGEVGISISSSNNVSYVYKKDGVCTVPVEKLFGIFDSFPPDRKINIETTKKKIKFYSKNEKGDMEFHYTPLYIEERVRMPLLATKFFKIVTIDRKVFIENSNKINFAIGFEEKRPHYLYWLMEIRKNRVKFLTGTGARYAISEIEGSDIISCDGDMDFMFTKNATPVVLDILSSSKGEKITIKQAKSQVIEGQNISNQIVIEFDDKQMVLVGFNPEMDWSKIPFNNILDRENKLSIVTDVSNWKYAVKGTSLTYDQDIKKEHISHNANVDIDLKKEQLNIKIDSKDKTSRIVQINEIKNNSMDNSFEFSCNHQFLAEIISYSKDEQQIQIEVDAPNKPVIVKHFDKEDKERGLKEKFTVFFATTNK